MFTFFRPNTIFLFTFSLVLGVFGATVAFAQRTLAPTYFDRNGQKTVKSKCYTYLVEKSKYNEVDSVVSYYCSTNRPQAVVGVSETILHGRTMTYYEDGSPETRAYFHNSTQVDTVTQWYSGGRMHYQRYWGTPGSPKDMIINYWDSSGVQLVKNGYGECRCIWKLPALIETGRVKAGLKDSVWTTSFPNGTVRHRETYKMGHVVDDFSAYGGLPDSTVFTAVETTAKPVGGMGEFYDFVARTLRYPKLARTHGIEGKVFVEFIIEKDGTLSDIFVVKGIGGGCDEEAVRIISLARPWIPAEQRGQKVRQRMVLPINFKLEYPRTKKKQ